MSKVIVEDKLSFCFPSDWHVIHYDKSEICKQFNSIGTLINSRLDENKDNSNNKKKNKNKNTKGVKAVDILAIDPEETLWLIEVKDYRPREITSKDNEKKEIIPEIESEEALINDITLKVICTLSALLPSKIHATNDNERAFIEKILSTVKKIRVVWHLEGSPRSTLHPNSAFNPVAVGQKLSQKLKTALKTDSLVMDMAFVAQQEKIEWTVIDIEAGA